MDIPCGYIETELEARFEFMRTRETNIANWIGDIFRTEYDTDFYLANSGTLRSNYIIEKGPITKKTIMNIFPYLDIIVVAQMTGKTFKEALENGVSQYPNYDGRFPVVSGVKFSFDPEKPPY
jgi:5'-nucleotidase